MTDRMMQFFAYEHLPPHLREVSQPFGELAQRIVDTLPPNAERTAGLRKLLEAKDCAVRARLYKEPDDAGRPVPKHGSGPLPGRGRRVTARTPDP